MVFFSPQKLFSLLCVAIAFCTLTDFASAATPASQSEGLTITTEVDPHPGTTDLAKRLSKIEQENQKLRASILQIQDDSASQQKNVVNIRIEALAENANSSKAPIGFVELAASLNDVEIVRYSEPPMTEKSPRYPLYVGPIPMGTYNLKVQFIAGVLQQGWPYNLLQGRWQAEKTFPLKIDSAMRGKTATILLKAGETAPSLHLVQAEESPP
jgi:hypothetical protein